MLRRPPRSTLDRSSAASDVYKRQPQNPKTPCSLRGGVWTSVGSVIICCLWVVELSYIAAQQDKQMEKKCNFKEFYCAANSSQPIRITSNRTEETSTIAPLCSQKLLSQLKNSRRVSVKNLDSSIKQLKPKVVTSAYFPLQSAAGDLANSQTNRKSSFCQPSQSPTVEETLTEFLSPSPFRNEDPDRREEILNHLVAFTPGKTRKMIFSQFYGSEMMGEESHRVWKIALKHHIVHTFESICLIKRLSPLPLQIIESKKQTITSLTGKKLLIFDLDETLVHCIMSDIEKADHIINVTLSTDKQVSAGVYIRPYAVECLKELKEYYDLIVFTASDPSYANIVIDILDPDKKLFSARLFRKSCIRTDIGLYLSLIHISEPTRPY
eukprot:TRINITY_DN3378_c0_g1_i11.p1 TRINITY_DN3378_c0_g1~~TRINITY_DN3378_c0_g1_i11.p1  ORF type:complete len:388 (+),score=57.05 TRINITY_DN3378_c0_g1_i11:24-1166(+)